MNLKLIGMLLSLALAWPGIGWGAQLASDDFNRANGGLGANWTTVTGLSAPAIATNQVQPAAVGGSSSQALYTATSWPDNQYATITVNTLNTNATRIAGVILRGTTGELTEYLAIVKGPFGATSTLTVLRYNAGTPTTIYTETTKTLTAGTVVKFEIIGSTLRVYYDGVDKTGDINDGSPITSGTPGLYAYTGQGVVSDVRIDDWIGGSSSGCTGGLMMLGVGSC